MTLHNPLLEHLPDPDLARDLGYIDGRWTNGAATMQFDVTDPATGAVLASLPDMGALDTSAAIAAAHDAQPHWALRPAKQRSAVLRRWNDLLVENAEGLAAIITAEMGKPLAEARAEVLYAASYLEWYAEEAKRIHGDIMPAPQPDRRMLTIRQPIGVVGAITPWNFPAAMMARKAAPALAAGCALVCKPAEQTPLTAIALAVLAERAGLPAGVLNVVVGTGAPAIGKVLCEDTRVRKLSFTGSTEVGRVLMRECATQIKKVSLELGGNAPFIVFDDADIEAAVDGAIAAKYRNSGQTCVCANRIYVQSGIYDVFTRRLRQKVAHLKVGNGFERDVAIGPLINEAAIVKVEAQMRDAEEKGARVVVGGRRAGTNGSFFLPTILVGVDQDMAIAREETFGPVAPLFRFETAEEVIRQANDTSYGLAAYFYTRDHCKIWTVAEALEVGMVGINTGLISSEAAPFGGIKQSGIGREGSRYGLEDYLELKYICMGGLELQAGSSRD